MFTVLVGCFVFQGLAGMDASGSLQGSIYAPLKYKAGHWHKRKKNRFIAYKNI